MKKFSLFITVIVLSFLFINNEVYAQVEYPNFLKQAGAGSMQFVQENGSTYEYIIDYYPGILVESLEINDYFLVTDMDVLLRKGLDRRTNSYELEEIYTIPGRDSSVIYVRITVLKSIVDDYTDIWNFFRYDTTLYITIPDDSTIGYDIGYDEGYDIGYDEGYDEGYDDGKFALTEDLINYYLYDEYIVATPVDIGDIHKFDGWSVFSPYENNENVILYDVDKRYLTIGVNNYHDDVLIYVKENITTASTVMLANVPDDLGSYRDDFDFILRTRQAIDEFTIDNQIFYTFDMLAFYQDCKIAIDVWGYEIDYYIFGDVINNSLRIYFTDEPLNYSLLTDYYFKGYDDGYKVNISRETAYQTGYDDGYNNGLKANDEDIYKEGFKEGSNESFIGSIDKWLVPAIIVVMLLGGFFAIARKKRDGDI